MNTTTAAREGAIEAAGHGWFLARLSTQPGCMKDPVGRWKKGVNDLGEIEKWPEDANFAVLASKNDLVILDEDAYDELDRLAADLGFDLPPTFTVKTGKGRHLYFVAEGVKYDQKNRLVDDGYQIDVRFDGYVVGPGSTHEVKLEVDTFELDESGEPITSAIWVDDFIYEVLDGRDPAPVPAQLREYLTKVTETPSERLEAPEGAEAPPVDPEWFRGAKKGALADLAETVALPEGAADRNGKTWESGALHARACRLVEVSNADRQAYPIEDARADYVGAAPSGFERSFAHHWESALEQVGHRRAKPRDASLDFAEPLADLPAQAAPDEEDKFAPLDWDEMFSGPPPEPEWLIEPIIERGQQISFFSKAGAGKSLVMLDMLWRACAGVSALGQEPKPPIRVLYIDAENTKKDLWDRLNDMKVDRAAMDRFVYLSFTPLEPLDTTRGAAKLVELVEKHEPDLVVIDTISRFIEGEENTSDTWHNLYRRALRPLKAKEVAFIRLDHTGKDEERGERGSSAKNSDVDAAWRLIYDDKKDPTHRYLTRTKTRTGNGPKDLVLDVLLDPLRHVEQKEFGPDPVAELIDQLDELGVPDDVGRRRAADLLRENGHSPTEARLREAIRLRRDRGGAE